jgi:hypothetical protein
MRPDLHILGSAALVACLFRTAAAADPKPAEIAAKMADVADELNRQETGEPVQGEQKAIVRDLDALIAALEKQCQACRGGIKRNNPRQGLPDSIISAGTGGMGALADKGENGKDWSKLSDRERDRILQSMSEGFPPEYRAVLERYYRRLADEKSASPAGGRPREEAQASPKP